LLTAENGEDKRGRSFDDQPKDHPIDQREHGKCNGNLNQREQSAQEFKRYHGTNFIIIIVFEIGISLPEQANVPEPKLLGQLLVDVNALAVKGKEDLVYHRHGRVNKLHETHFAQVYQELVVVQ